MKTIPLFLVAFVAVFLVVGQVHAVTIVNSKYVAEDMSAGETRTFTSTLQLSGSEKVVDFNEIVVSGDIPCTEWVKTDRTSAKFTGPTSLTTTVKVSDSAFVGDYSCQILLKGNPQGSIRPVVGIPVKISVTTGQPRPVITSVSTPVITAEPAQTSAQQVATVVPAVKETMQVPSNIDMWKSPLLGALFIATGMFLALCAVIVYDERRGRKPRKPTGVAK